MRYNLKDTVDAHKAFAYLVKLTDQEAIVDIKKFSPKRSLKQNSYLHLTFSIFGLELGYTTQESKTIYKRLANPNLYIYKKGDNTFLKSSADLTTKEMTDSIDKWRMYASEQGVDIPAPNDNDALIYWGNQIEKEGKWL